MIEFLFALFVLLAVVDVGQRMRDRHKVLQAKVAAVRSAMQGEVNAVRSANVQLGRMVVSLRSILSDEVAYVYRLEQLTFDWRSWLPPADTDALVVLLDSRPPIQHLLECIDAQNWDALERLRRGEKSQIQ